MKSLAASLAMLDSVRRDAFLDELSGNALAAMPWIWDVWSNPLHQAAPDGDWLTWVILGGRGAGKTRAGAEWVRSRVEGATPDAPGNARRVALVGETLDQDVRSWSKATAASWHARPPTAGQGLWCRRTS